MVIFPDIKNRQICKINYFQLLTQLQTLLLLGVVYTGKNVERVMYFSSKNEDLFSKRECLPRFFEIQHFWVKRYHFEKKTQLLEKSTKSQDFFAV